MSTSKPPLGRRAQNKERTRQTLLEAASVLIARQGFAGTTVQQIAQAAEVSERTFFRYFACKEDIVLQNLIQFFARIEEHLLQRPIDEEPLEAIRFAMLATTSEIPHHLAGRLVPDDIASHPSVGARLITLFTEWEMSLSEILFDRLSRIRPHEPEQTNRLHATVIAHASVGASRASVRMLRQVTGPETLTVVTRHQVVNAAFDLLANGCHVLS